MFQVNHMKTQALFSSKDKGKQLNVVCCNICSALYGLIKNDTFALKEVQRLVLLLY